MANKRGKRRSSDRLFSWAPKSVDSNCSHEIQRHLLFGRKAMTNLDNTLKSKDITLPTTVYSHSYDFSSRLVQMWDKECWAPKNWCFWFAVLEKTRETLGLQGDQTSQSYRKSTLNMHWKDWWWSWSSSTLVTWCKEPTHWKIPWCWERLRAGGEEGDRGWDG